MHLRPASPQLEWSSLLLQQQQQHDNDDGFFFDDDIVGDTSAPPSAALSRLDESLYASAAGLAGSRQSGSAPSAHSHARHRNNATVHHHHNTAASLSVSRTEHSDVLSIPSSISIASSQQSSQGNIASSNARQAAVGLRSSSLSHSQRDRSSRTRQPKLYHNLRKQEVSNLTEAALSSIEDISGAYSNTPALLVDERERYADSDEELVAYSNDAISAGIKPLLATDTNQILPSSGNALKSSLGVHEDRK